MSASSDFEIPFPLEFVINQTPLSVQAANARAKDDWKRTVGRHAAERIRTFRELYFLDDRPIMATLYYFPAAKMDGDIDNIVKLVLDGMIAIAYPDDRCIERIVVQKFEPGVAWLFRSPTPSLAHAIGMPKPALYIRLEDGLHWREAS